MPESLYRPTERDVNGLVPHPEPPTVTLAPFAAQARAVGNAVYLEHVGSSGDIAAWGCESPDRAAFVAGQINAVLTGLRAEFGICARAGVPRPATDLDIISALGPGTRFDADDIAAFVESARNDPDEGVEWLPYYKAALAMLAAAHGYAVGVIDSLGRRHPPGHPRRVEAELAMARLRSDFRAHLRVVGLGPDYHRPEAVERVEKRLADFDATN